MKNSTQKSIKSLSIAILVLYGLALIFSYGHMYFQLTGHHIDPVVWNPNQRIWQIAVIAGRVIGTALLFALCWIFLHRTNQGLKNGEIFPKSNISLLRWTALVAAFTSLAHCNFEAVVKGESRFCLDFDTIFIPLFILLFAGLYKMAYLAAKDSKLAI